MYLCIFVSLHLYFYIFLCMFVFLFISYINVFLSIAFFHWKLFKCILLSYICWCVCVNSSLTFPPFQTQLLIQFHLVSVYKKIHQRIKLVFWWKIIKDKCIKKKKRSWRDFILLKFIRNLQKKKQEKLA